MYIVRSGAVWLANKFSPRAFLCRLSSLARIIHAAVCNAFSKQPWAVFGESYVAPFKLGRNAVSASLIAASGAICGTSAGIIHRSLAESPLSVYKGIFATARPLLLYFSSIAYLMNFVNRNRGVLKSKRNRG